MFRPGVPMQACRSNVILAASGLALVLAFAATSALSDEPDAPLAPAPLARAHAHNDYEHERPLLDALAQGFCSVEADIFLVDGALLVAHTRLDLKPERTLEKLYLEPLRERVRANGGRVFKGGPEFTLLIDLKTSGEPTYRALVDVLGRYADMLSTVRDGKVEKRGIRVVVSGNRPRDLMEKETKRLAGYDGRLADLDIETTAAFMPLVSDHWGNNFTWRGEGDMPAAEKRKLDEIVAKAHARGQRVRFWATPESEALWKELHAAGVDLINTDQLARLRRFLESRAKKGSGDGASDET